MSDTLQRLHIMAVTLTATAWAAVLLQAGLTALQTPALGN